LCTFGLRTWILHPILRVRGRIRFARPQHGKTPAARPTPMDTKQRACTQRVRVGNHPYALHDTEADSFLAPSLKQPHLGL